MDISHEVKVLAHLLRRAFDCSETREYAEQMTGSNIRVIGYLAHAKGDVFQRDLEAHFSVRRSTASRMVQSLVDKGLIRRESVDSDGRLKRLVLTEQGRELDRQVLSALEDIDRRMTEGISQEELASFLEILEKMKANLSCGECGCSCDRPERKRKESV